VIEDQPRRRNRNVGSRHRRFRRRSSRQTRIGPRGIVRKRQQGTAERAAGRRNAMLGNEGAYARIELGVGFKLGRREIVDTDERVAGNAPPALNAFQQARSFRVREAR
jgi:hypothetical protein